MADGGTQAVVPGAAQRHVWVPRAALTFRFVRVTDGIPDFWLGGLGLLMGGGFHCCECEDVERDAAPWGDAPPGTEGTPHTRCSGAVAAVDAAVGGQPRRPRHALGTRHSELYWHHMELLEMWPGAVCRRRLCGRGYPRSHPLIEGSAEGSSSRLARRGAGAGARGASRPELSSEAHDTHTAVDTHTPPPPPTSPTPGPPSSAPSVALATASHLPHTVAASATIADHETDPHVDSLCLRPSFRLSPVLLD